MLTLFSPQQELWKFNVNRSEAFPVKGGFVVAPMNWNSYCERTRSWSIMRGIHIGEKRRSPVSWLFQVNCGIKQHLLEIETETSIKNTV